MKRDNTMVWLRRNLRAFDHAILHHALMSSNIGYCACICGKQIFSRLVCEDRRVQFVMPRWPDPTLNCGAHDHASDAIVQLAGA